MLKWIVMAVVVAVAALIWNSGSTKRALTQVAAEMNRRVPVTVAPGVRVDKVVFANKQFDMYITFTDVKSTDVGQQQAMLDTMMKQALSKSICGNESLKKALSEHYLISSIVTGSDGREISKLRVSDTDCR
jgi:hypothetical protein